jgi:hypothetical protein
MAEIELGNGLPDVRTTKETDASLKAAGFELIDSRDLALDADIPWWDPVDPESWRLGSEWRLLGEGVGAGWRGRKQLQSALASSATAAPRIGVARKPATRAPLTTKPPFPPPAPARLPHHAPRPQVHPRAG